MKTLFLKRSIFMFLFLSPFMFRSAYTQCSFTEKDGILIIEAENLTDVKHPWLIVEEANTSGGKYITFKGGNQYAKPNGAEIYAKFQIVNPGRYQFKWFMRQPNDVASDKANDTWIDFPDAKYYQGSQRIYGYKKMYGNAKGAFQLQGRLDINHNHGSAFVEFDKPGEYTLKMAGRSQNHQIDKLALYKCSDGELTSEFRYETSTCDNDYSKDCSGKVNGDAFIDSCNFCVGGKTDKSPCHKDFSQAISIPGVIETERFRDGGEGVAYFDIDKENTGGLFRISEAVDLIDGPSGYAVTDIEDGEWLAYSVEVEDSGVYTFFFSYNAPYENGLLELDIDGEQQTNRVVLQKSPTTKYTNQIVYLRLVLVR